MNTTTNTVTVRLRVEADGALRDLDRFDKELQETAQSAARAGSATGAFEAQLKRMTAAQQAGIPVQEARVASMSREEKLYQRLAASSSAESRIRLKAEQDLSRAAAAASNLVVQGKLREEDALRDLMALEQARAAQIDAAIVDAQRLAAANDTVAASNMRVGRTADRAAVRQNLMYQYADVGVSLASGMPAHMVAIQQGAQIVGGPGGLNAALAETGALARMVVTRFGLIGAAIAGGLVAIDSMTDSINETSDVTVTWGDTALATVQVIAGGLYSVVQPAVDAVSGWFADNWATIVDITKTTVNLIVRGFVGGFTIVSNSVQALPDIFALAGAAAANAFIRAINAMVNQVAAGLNVIISGVNEMGANIALIEPPNLKEFEAEAAIAQRLNDRYMALGETMAGIAKADYAGQLFDAIEVQAIENARNRLSETEEAAKGAGGAAKKAADDTKKLTDELTAAEKAAQETAEALGSTLGEAFSSLFDGPITDLEDALDGILSSFAQLGQQNLSNVFQGMFSTPANENLDPIGSMPSWQQMGDFVEKGAAKGTKAGAEGGIFSGLGALFGGKDGQGGTALTEALNMGLGGLGIGYSMQDPMQGAIGGAMQGLPALFAGNPIPALIGGLGGFIGGLFGASKALKEAQAALAKVRGEIDNFIDVGQGRGLGEMTKAFRDVKDQALEFEEVAQEADNFDLVAEIQDSVNQFFHFLNTDFMLGFQGTIDALRSGQGMSGAFVTAQSEVTDLREELKGFVADAQFMGDELARLSGKDLTEETAARVAEARDAAQAYALSILAGADAQTEYEDATATARGQASALQVTLEQLGMEADKAAAAIDDALNVALAKLTGEYLNEVNSSINDLSGLGYLNDIMEAQADYQASLRDAAALGLDGSLAMRELNLSLADIVQSAGLSAEHLDMLAAAFPLMSGLIDTLAGQEAMQTVADARADLRRAYDDEISIIESTISRLERFTRSIREFRAEMRIDASSPLGQRDQMEEALRQFRETAGLALSGDQEAQDRLTDVSQSALDEARAYYASSEAYAEIWREIDATLSQVESSAGRQLTEAQRQMDLLNQQVSGLIDINDSVVSVEDAISNLAAAMENSQNALRDQIAAMQNASKSAIEAAYQSNLGRSADQSGLDFYQDQISRGKSVDRVVSEIADSPEARIQKLYRDIFGRSADAAGLSFYLNSGKSISQIEADLQYAKLHGAMQAGGIVGAYQGGGIVGNGMFNVDSVLARYAGGGMIGLAGGEGVMNARSLQSIGPQNFEHMNRTGRIPGNDNSDVVAELRALRQDNSQLTRAVERMGTIIGLSDEETREVIRNGNNTQAEVASELRRRNAA
ncbi:hypothetical protein GCM10007989_02100 [Devosia pacifica]|uniref:DUF4214 domain-containing protein n=1 Tax=Devosia pacifica TaxID=1335967 RepID=A0A918VLN8_9HYPH|nr:DUF4214 domain-containing protein [Devosia pacifica]GHA11376.1 hypothetical protein GCM10007989_02100 [Devosia pacifica]